MGDLENLFCRLKGQSVIVKTVSGGVYEGRIGEVTADYVCLIEHQGAESTEVFLFFRSLESAIVVSVPEV
jgi:hypothetical protein